MAQVMQILLHGLKNTELHDLLYGKIRESHCICTGNELEKISDTWSGNVKGILGEGKGNEVIFQIGKSYRH